MTGHTQVMKQALDALNLIGNKLVPDYGSGHFAVERSDKARINNAIANLRAAIEAAEKQEPTAWIGIGGQTDLKGGACRKLFWEKSEARNDWAKTWKPLYDEPQPYIPEGYRPIDERA